MKKALRDLLNEAVDWQYVLGKGGRPTLDKAITQARVALKPTRKKRAK